MTVLETLIYALIIGALSFVIGYLIIALTVRKNGKLPKSYRYKGEASFDLKGSVDRNSMGSETTSGVDGSSASSDFID